MEDSKDIDDDSSEVHATKIINISDLDEVMEEVNSLQLEDRMYTHNVSNTILGSWFTTPRKSKLQNLLKMYGNGNPSKDDQIFSTSIQDMDSDRDHLYNSKLDVSNDLDNIYGDQHEVCAESGFGHKTEEELGTGPERYTAECHVLNVNKWKFYSLSWEEIAEAAEKDEFLVKLKTAMLSNNIDQMEELLKNKRIHCAQSKNGLQR